LFPAQHLNLLIEQIRHFSSLKLHHQVRLANRLEWYLHDSRVFSFQLHADFSVRITFQAPFKKLGFADGFAGRNLRQAPGEALELRGLFQRAIHSRRADFQDVTRPRNQLFHVENHAELLAHALAIGVADVGERTWRIPCFNRICELRGGHTVDVHPEKPLLADLPFDIHDFQAFGTRHTFRGVADFFQIHLKTPRPKPVESSAPPAATKKWACAHSMVRPDSERSSSIFRETGKCKVPEGLAAATRSGQPAPDPYRL